MASHNEIARRWAEQVGRKSPRYIGGRRSNNVFVDRERIYSYGSHFEMGRLVGDRGTGFFLLNGDRYSPTTNQHQAKVRGAVADTGIPSAVIPYTALAAAGIELDSIRPLEVQPDRIERWTEDVGEAWTLDDPRAVAVWDYGSTPHSSEYPFPSYGQGRPAYIARKWTLPGSDVEAVETLHGWQHLEVGGEFLPYSPGENVRYYHNGSGVEIIGGRFHVQRNRHFLGACLFTARVAGRKQRAKFLSAFDENERQPLYFLCELPRCSARTYAEALDALAPRIVHAALAQGREVVRQGDIFAIPTELDRATLRKRGARFDRRSDDGPFLLDTNHRATETAQVGKAVYVRGMMYHDPGFRERDHARAKLGDGKTWHLVAKNTVPQVRGQQRTGAGRL